ncbi:MAG: hypothetical protein AABW49_04050 [Nanoarchaeota archaeon]
MASEAAQEPQIDHAFNVLIECKASDSQSYISYIPANRYVSDNATKISDYHNVFRLCRAGDPMLSDPCPCWISPLVYTDTSVLTNEGTIVKHCSTSDHRVLVLRDGRVFVNNKTINNRYNDAGLFNMVHVITDHAMRLFDDEELEKRVRHDLNSRHK